MMWGISEGFAGAMIMMFVIAVLVGVAIGGVVFEGIPWLYHHLSIRWS